MEELPVFFTGMLNHPKGHEILREFQKELLKNNIYHKFLYNFYTHGFPFERERTPQCFIFNAFTWGNTSDGIHWSTVDLAWVNICRRKKY